MTPLGKAESLIESHIGEKSDRHIVFLVTQGFSARTVIRSGLAHRLVLQGARVTVVSRNANEIYFQEECYTDGLELKQEPKCGGRIAHRFRAYRPYLLDDVMNNPALRSHHVRRCEEGPWVGWVMETVNQTLARSAAFRWLSRAAERRINRSSAVQQLLAQLRPTLLVLPNPFGIEETIYLLHARELRIPVACQMLSWDNITAKGTPLLMPDYFISWGPIMTKEIENLYHFPRNRIYECGVPHFDVYSHIDQIVRPSTLLTELGLPPRQPYIFYGMVIDYSCPNELEILAWLANKVNRNAFIKPCSLVIRPHPQMISGFYARSSRDFERLRSLASERVVVNTPSLQSEQLAWDLPKSDMVHLANLLANSAMCINSNSTLCLDACMLDRPVINIAFDGTKPLPYEKSARRGLDYIHMAKLLAFGGIRIAKSFNDLTAHINAYLTDPGLDRAGRILSVSQECGPRDGRSAERAANTLLQLADRRHCPPLQLTTHSDSAERPPVL